MYKYNGDSKDLQETPNCEICGGVSFIFLLILMTTTSSSSSSSALFFFYRSAKVNFRRKLYYMPSLATFERRHTPPRLRLLPKAKKTERKKRAWWHRFFSDEDDEIWSGWNSAADVTTPDGSDDNDDDDFEAWKRRAEAISELREAQEDAKIADGREWEDWLGGGGGGRNDSSASADVSTSSSLQDWGGKPQEQSAIYDDPMEIMSDKGLVGYVKTFMTGDDDDDDLMFEDRVFRYASTNSAKFVAFLILVPWALDFLVHDYLLMPFLDRYVKTVPLAAEMLDVRRNQKLEMVKALKVERARFDLEVEIGKSPPLSDKEVWLELRHKAIELRDEWRLENQRAFANIWSDMVYGISLFILIYSNKSRVALLKFTGYKLLNNISDTGKAFLIILITDIFLGYHSESGWQALVEIILEHYGLEVNPAAITVFICFVPVVVDACVKLWLFKFLPRLSPNVTNIFREMQRH